VRAVQVGDDGLELAEVAEPNLSDPREVLVRVRLAGICSTDRELRRGYMGFRGVPGHEFVGEVVQAPAALQWVGRRVVGEINAACRTCPTCRAGVANHCPNRTVLGILGRSGTHAELLSLPIDNLHAVPASLSDEVAVFTEPLAAAFEPMAQGLRFDPGEPAYVLGDGKLGLLQARVLTLMGADVTVFGRHAQKLAIAEKWGARVGYTADADTASKARVVAECTGSAAGLATALSLTRPRGTLILKSTYAGESSVNLAPIVIDEIQIMGSRCGPFPEALSALVASQVAVSDLVDETYPLEDGLTAYERAAERGVLKVLIRP
jgi:threonine dehydrogenase-like Zn-dependent dehydrogenase